MRICKKCIQPDTRPKIYFDDDGVCGACLWEEEKKKINWSEREKHLQKIVNWAKKTTKSNYDCVIGVSGGKDSLLQALIARDRLGLHCLLVNGEPENITDIGRDNIENLKQLGFDVISLRPNPKIKKKLIRYDFFKYGNPMIVTEHALWSSTYIIAEKFNIPLIIQGENPALTLGVSAGGLSKGYDALEANKQNTLSIGWKEYLNLEGVTERDLFMLHYDDKKLRDREIKGIWIQYFLKEWSLRKNAEFAKQHGLRCRPENFDPESIGTYVPWAQLDSDLVQVAQLLKYIKFGFGQCTDYACYDIREGIITQERGIELVKKYDGKCSEEYIKKFCDYIGISLEEFWQTANQFRGPTWTKKNDGNWHNSFLDTLESMK